MENLLLDKPRRRRAITWALTLQPTSAVLAPLAHYEQALAGCKASYVLPIPQLLGSPGNEVEHVLYSSRAVQPFSEAQLIELLEMSRAYNQQHGITGLLCYRAGHFVQVLEGPVAEVNRLFASIEQDKRLRQVCRLSAGASYRRRFADWNMAFSPDLADETEFYWLISYLEARQHKLIVPQIPITEPALLALLLAFSTC